MALYTVSFRRSAEKDLQKLDATMQRRVIRIRVGDYRVIYTLDDDVKVVAVERVRHRREVYR